MFEQTKPYYMTRAVAAELSEEHKLFILQYMHEHQVQLTDYLQVFEFYIEKNEQFLIQRQEEPDRETTILVELKNSTPINRKVWMIDSGDYVMLLFPENY